MLSSQRPGTIDEHEHDWTARPVRVLDRFTTYGGHRERVIIVARILMAGLLILVLSLDPPAPEYRTFAVEAVAIIAGYATLMTIHAWRADAFTHWWPLALHSIDIGAALVLVRFTGASTSPFFVALLFPLIPGTLRWRWRGMAWTTVLVVGGFLAIGLQETLAFRDARFNLNTLLLRAACVAGVGLILGCMEAYEQRSRLAIARVASWSGATTVDEEEFLSRLLRYVAETLEAPRVLLVWRPSGAGMMNLVEWAEGATRRDTETVAVWATALARSVRDADFVCADADVRVPEVMYTSSSGLQRWQGAPMTGGFSARFSMRSVLSLRLHASGLSGRLFVLDKPQLTGDELVLGALVAHEIETSLEHHCMLQRLRDAAASEARLRVARDVHDDVLQTMTAISLGLETVGRLIEQAPGRAREQIAELQGRLGSDQRSLRTAVRGLKRRAAPPAQLAAQLAEMVGDVEQEWGLPVKLDSELRGVTVSDSLGHEIRQIVREAVVNAARHASASAVSVSVGHGQGELHLAVIDDGCGFPFHGKYSDADRRRLRVGPGVLAERVEALGGSLAIDSSNSGARLDIRIPLA